jgi:hypothetical protein
MALRRAFEFERDAADLLSDAENAEPSRSVLHRSAATLARDVGEVDEADRLIEQGLRGQPPPSIAAELEELRKLIQGRFLISVHELEEPGYRIERAMVFSKGFVAAVTSSYAPPSTA